MWRLYRRDRVYECIAIMSMSRAANGTGETKPRGRSVLYSPIYKLTACHTLQSLCVWVLASIFKVVNCQVM